MVFRGLQRFVSAPKRTTGEFKKGLLEHAYSGRICPIKAILFPNTKTGQRKNKCTYFCSQAQIFEQKRHLQQSSAPNAGGFLLKTEISARKLGFSVTDTASVEVLFHSNLSLSEAPKCFLRFWIVTSRGVTSPNRVGRTCDLLTSQTGFLFFTCLHRN